MFCAHINPKTKEEQSVIEHLYNVSAMSKKYGAKISLESVGELIGILHDMGKETDRFNRYIHYSSLHPEDKSQKGLINHSTAGAKYIFDNFSKTKDQYQRFTAQLISLTICSHHGGLIDCIDLSGMDVFTNKMNPPKDILYEETLNNYEKEYGNMQKINDLFDKSINEIKEILVKVNKIDKDPQFIRFATGMIEKYLFSCVIDADRYDTYAFMEGKEYKQENDITVLWKELSETLEKELSKYPQTERIEKLRNEISLACKDFAHYGTGIYKLSVPTGGGKTLSSLRFALAHAKKFNKDRVLYVIPFTTIIDQNAKDIKKILKRSDVILEHHSNVIIDNEQEDYKLLTESWDNPIILTTMVQFLDTLFSGGTQNIRRMHNLANSVIIFDEIQAIPIKCINMFNSAINFLSNVCNATIVLCTATQPLLSTTQMPLKLSEYPDMVPNVEEKFRQFKRVNVVDRRVTGGYSIDCLKKFILDEFKKVESMLVILNTKNAAKELFNALNQENNNFPEEEKYYIFHLSTNMCPAHRISILNNMKEKLGKHKVICISTQLIEAGVNISFECVIRSLAGLDSIAQAAGRCNRHGEKVCGNVYIVNIEEENVDKLLDIKKAQECTRRVLDEFEVNSSIFENDLLSLKVMNLYYQYYFYNRKSEMNYTLSKPNNDKTMYDLLSQNSYGVNAFRGRNMVDSNLMLRQAFKTAGDNFQVIDQMTTCVIVPYENGEKIIALINGEFSLAELKDYLRKAQQFSVNLYDTDIKKLAESGGVYELKNEGVIALKPEFYDNDMGVVFEKQPMKFYNF